MQQLQVLRERGRVVSQVWIWWPMKSLQLFIQI